MGQPITSMMRSADPSQLAGTRRTLASVSTWCTLRAGRHLKTHIRTNAATSIQPSGDAWRPEVRHTWLAYQKDQLQKMLKFMGPALLIPMGDPLMTLVDTVCIGQFAGTTELAAMGPANMVFAFCIYVFQCLQVATLSLVASHLRDGQKRAAAHNLGTALSIALVGGLASTVVLIGFSSQVISLLGVKDQALVPLAADYIRVRALAQPAVLMTMVAQSGMIAQQDSLTPCLAVVLTVTSSLLANLVFVAWLGWGLQGAAITTVGTQYIGIGALLWALHRKQSNLIPDWTPPSITQLLTFLRTCAPLAVVSLSKNTCYLIMSTTAATLPTLYLAAHQAAFSVWALCTWTISPVEQACLAYFPGAKKLWQQQALAQLVMALGVVVAVTAGLIVGGVLALTPGLLSKDIAIQPFMRDIALQAGLSMLLVGIDVSAQAMNLALKDFPYVARSYVVTLGAIASYFWVCRTQGWGLGGVWWGLMLFFGVRAVQSVLRATFHLYLEPGRTATAGEDPMLRPATALLDAVQGSKDSTARARDASDVNPQHTKPASSQNSTSGEGSEGPQSRYGHGRLEGEVVSHVQGGHVQGGTSKSLSIGTQQQTVQHQQSGDSAASSSPQETVGNGHGSSQQHTHVASSSWHVDAPERTVSGQFQTKGTSAHDKGELPPSGHVRNDGAVSERVRGEHSEGGLARNPRGAPHCDSLDSRESERFA